MGVWAYGRMAVWLYGCMAVWKIRSRKEYGMDRYTDYIFRPGTKVYYWDRNGRSRRGKVICRKDRMWVVRRFWEEKYCLLTAGGLFEFGKEQADAMKAGHTALKYMEELDTPGKVLRELYGMACAKKDVAPEWKYAMRQHIKDFFDVDVETGD